MVLDHKSVKAPPPKAGLVNQLIFVLITGNKEVIETDKNKHTGKHSIVYSTLICIIFLLNKYTDL